MTKEAFDETEVTTSRASEVVEETIGVLGLREVVVAAFAEVETTAAVVARTAVEDARTAVLVTDMAVVVAGINPAVGAPARA